MNTPNNRIVEFINKHHVLTLATCHNEEPWCASCFYVYMEDECSFVISSNFNTKHIQQASHNIIVAGSIVLETKAIGKIQGVQFQGIINQLQDQHLEKARRAYIKRFPVALLKEDTLWSIDITLLKMTDNRLGFGEKIIWKIDSL